MLADFFVFIEYRCIFAEQNKTTMLNYKNGNADITLEADGTRIISFEDNLILDRPLNIDIKVTSKCAFGFNPKTGTSFCSFCHESARTDGKECDYEKLKGKLGADGNGGEFQGMELAIGGNQITDGLIDFLSWAKGKGFICNLTINMGHLNRDKNKILHLLENDLIKGLGVSYRNLDWNVPEFVLEYPNTVFHVIAGIDTFNEVESLATKGVKKILVLGEKDFGFNLGKVDTSSQNHKEWRWFVRKLFDTFEVISFDNLALEQLNIKRFFLGDSWEQFYQGEHSFYIDAVNEYFAPSSRNPNKTDWNETNIIDYFKQLEK
jgi:hypothetical protein